MLVIVRIRKYHSWDCSPLLAASMVISGTVGGETQEEGVHV